MSRHMFRCKIVQFVGPGVRWLHFIGPSIDHVPAGWSIMLRKVAK